VLLDVLHEQVIDDERGGLQAPTGILTAGCGETRLASDTQSGVMCFWLMRS
jgi:hypothetical protein